ncbi:MAG: hypothetical protein PHU49_00355 [Syntrophorhabdaceae bacterium]|nr:hypothetical protein [Syntrophorhabdaceae bacterium]
MATDELRAKIVKYQQEVKEKADSYERTILTIICFDSAVRWDAAVKDYFVGSHFLPCRRLSKVGANGNVTPDVVVQLSEHNGIVGEVKITASTERDFDRAFEQMQNYDQELKGWRTEDEAVGMHDLALLVDDLERTAAKNYFGSKSFERNFTLIACAVQRRAKEVCKIEKYYGAFSDERVEQKLAEPVPVPLEELIGQISAVKFYDTPPPTEYTMNILWMNVFNELKERNGERKDKSLTVECKEITRMLCEKFSFEQQDERQPKIPKEAWVREALDALVSIQYAQKDPVDGNKYYIQSYQKKGDMLAVFSKKRFEALLRGERRSISGKQEHLFEV